MSDRPPTDPDDRTDGGDRQSPDADTGTSDEHPDETAHEAETESSDRSDRVAFWVSAAIGLVLGIGAIALVSGRAPFFEDLLRVRPTVDGGGIGADWIVGNTGPFLETAIFLVHLADVVMGIFILLILFIHWAAFRRLAARMQPPAATARGQETTAATDGGLPDSEADSQSTPDSSTATEPRGDSSTGPDDDTAPSDGGELP